MAKISNFLIGDPSQANISAIMLTLQHAYSGRGLFKIRNFDNTGIPGLMAGAVLDVAGSLYLEETEQVCQYRNGIGEIQNISYAPDGDYHMIAIPSSDSIIIAAVSGLTPTFDTDYGAFYENSTANRVLGGFTKTGSAYTEKWAYLFDPHLNTFMTVASDGVYLSANDIDADIITASTLTISDNLGASGQTHLAKYKQTYHELNSEFLPSNTNGFVVTSPCIIYMTYINFFPGAAYGIAVKVGASQYAIDYAEGKAFMLLPGRFIATTNNTKIIVLNACHDTLSDVMYNL